MKDWIEVDEDQVVVGDLLEFQGKMARVQTVGRNDKGQLEFYLDGLGPVVAPLGRTEVYR